MRFRLNQPFTLIFFQGRDKARMVEMRVGTLAILASIVLSLALWTLAGPFVIHGVVQEQNRLRDRVAVERTRIFDYQTHYENVFDRIYTPLVGAPNLLAEEAIDEREQSFLRAMFQSSAAVFPEEPEPQIDFGFSTHLPVERLVREQSEDIDETGSH